MANKHNQLDFVNNLQVTCEDGVTYQLYGGKPVNFNYLDGVGMPSIRRITQRTALQHGLQDRGFRLEPRRLTLSLTVAANNQVDADAKRDKMSYIFGPTHTPFVLKITKKDSTVRAIDCFVDGSIDFPMSRRVGATDFDVLVPLVADDPSFYNPTQQSTTVDLSSGSGHTGNNVSVSGVTWDDWPIIDVTGPITALDIDHTPANDSIVFSSAIPSGETFRIDLRPGYKTVKRVSDNANRLSYVNTNYIGSFSTMRVLSEKATQALNPGQTVNGFFFSGTGAGAGTQAVVYWYKRYLSL